MAMLRNPFIFSKRALNPTLIRSLTLLVAFASPFAANMYLPSLPSLAKHLKSTDELMEFTITVFILGFGVSQLIYGPLSDCFGRRKIIFIGMLIALVGSLACSRSHSGPELIMARFVLGCGVGAGAALTRSILRDSFNGIALTKASAQNGLIFTIAPVLAPLAGGYIQKWYGWEANFTAVAIFITFITFVIWFLLAETNKYPDVKAIYPKYIWRNYFVLFSNKTFLGYIFCAGFSVAGMSAFMTISPFLLEQVLGLSAIEYGWLTASVILGLLIGRMINMLLLPFLTAKQIITFGITIMIIAGITMLVPALLGILNIYAITIPVIIFVIGTGLIAPIAFAQSLMPFPNMAGAAGALYGSATLLISFMISAYVATLHDNNQTALALVYILLAVGVLLSYRLLVLQTASDKNDVISSANEEPKLES